MNLTSLILVLLLFVSTATFADQKSQFSENEINIVDALNALDDLAADFANMTKDGTAIERIIGPGRIFGVFSYFTGSLTGANPNIETYNRQKKIAALLLAQLQPHTSQQDVTETRKYFLLHGILPPINSNWQEFANFTQNLVNEVFVEKSARKGKMWDPQEAADYSDAILAKYMPVDEFKTFIKNRFIPSQLPNL